MENLKKKRAESLAIAVSKLMSRGVIDRTKYTLNAAFTNKAIEHYMQDLSALKKRYGIPDKAKMSKIAGLMAYAIVKFKPLIPVDGREQNFNDLSANEFLAIFYGLCVCADLGNGQIDGDIGLVISNPFFEEWFRNFKYLLEYRIYTAESLAMVFETLGFVFRNSCATEA